MSKFQNKFGTLEFDHDYLQFDLDLEAMAKGLIGPVVKLAFNPFYKFVSKASGAPKRSSGKIRVEQIDNIRFAEIGDGSRLTNTVVNSNLGGRIIIVTASGGPYSVLQIFVEKERIEDAKKFINLLHDVVLNQGRQVEATHLPNGSDSKVCPDCAETVKSEARKCRYCNYQFK